MIPLAKDCACRSHDGPHELAMRDAFKARRLAVYAAICVKSATSRTESDAHMMVILASKAEAARDMAEHCRWMHRLALAAFCRGCWQGFRADELPAACGCGTEHPAQRPTDLLALARSFDDRGHWPPRGDAEVRHG